MNCVRLNNNLSRMLLEEVINRTTLKTITKMYKIIYDFISNEMNNAS